MDLLPLIYVITFLVACYFVMSPVYSSFGLSYIISIIRVGDTPIPPLYTPIIEFL